jgi:long-chain acyl-CoA synthetase
MSDLGTICYSDNRLQVNPTEMRGAKLSLANEAFAADSYTDLLSFGSSDKMLVFMPFSDTANRSLSIHQAVNSGSMTFFGEEIDKLHANLTSVQPTVIYSAPVLWERFEAVIKARLGSGDPAALPIGVKEKLRRFIGCHNLRVAISGSAPVHADTIRFYEALGITLRNMYTKSSLSGICTLDMGGSPLLGAAGKAVPQVQIRIAPTGAIEVFGANVFMGYHNKTAHSGWLQTGDAGSLTENGDLILLGHMANCFKLKNGVEIHPESIELELRTSPIISGAYVFGNGRDFVAAIVAIEREALAATAKKLGKTVDELAQSPETLNEVDLHVQRVNAKLPEAQRVKKYRVIPREFSFKDSECTPTMLLNRSVVATKFAALRAEIFS